MSWSEVFYIKDAQPKTVPNVPWRWYEGQFHHSGAEKLLVVPCLHDRQNIMTGQKPDHVYLMFLAPTEKGAARFNKQVPHHFDKLVERIDFMHQFQQQASLFAAQFTETGYPTLDSIMQHIYQDFIDPRIRYFTPESVSKSLTGMSRMNIQIVHRTTNL